MARKSINSELAISIVVSLVILFVLYLAWFSIHIFVLSLLQLTNIFMAFIVFVVTWNSRRFLTNGTFLLLGVANLFVGIFDVMSFLTNPDLPILPMYNENCYLLNDNTKKKETSKGEYYDEEGSCGHFPGPGAVNFCSGRARFCC